MKRFIFRVRGCAWGFLAGLGVLLGCATVTETGRKQLLLISPAQEMQLGLTAFSDMKKEVPVSQDAAGNAMLQKVGKRIAAVATLTNAQWEFVLFDSKEVNAFCLPGGKVGVYTGILPITKDEAGLATVIGHEIAHAAAHHGGERMSQAMVVQGGGQVVNAVSASADPKWQAMIQGAYGLGGQLGYALPYSRLQESEADRIGLLYMTRAGYNPEDAIAFWQRFAAFNKQQGDTSLWFLRTHPLDEKRIEQLKQWLPEAKRQQRAVP